MDEVAYYVRNVEMSHQTLFTRWCPSGAFTPVYTKMKVGNGVCLFAMEASDGSGYDDVNENNVLKKEKISED
ncbi:hypothetical protein RUM44_002578 [Polyplax serrata]|uniref:Uncharacterized protein n=1 Tax=Polyplax serrata TaxID=468196 RepID=A0ABR1AGN9_POLSC